MGRRKDAQGSGLEQSRLVAVRRHLSSSLSLAVSSELDDVVLSDQGELIPGMSVTVLEGAEVRRALKGRPHSLLNVMPRNKLRSEITETLGVNMKSELDITFVGGIALFGNNSRSAAIPIESEYLKEERSRLIDKLYTIDPLLQLTGTEFHITVAQFMRRPTLSDVECLQDALSDNEFAGSLKKPRVHVGEPVGAQDY